jgi:hypothetical protein
MYRGAAWIPTIWTQAGPQLAATVFFVWIGSAVLLGALARLSAVIVRVLSVSVSDVLPSGAVWSVDSWWRGRGARLRVALAVCCADGGALFRRRSRAHWATATARRASASRRSRQDIVHCTPRGHSVELSLIRSSHESARKSRSRNPRKQSFWRFWRLKISDEEKPGQGRQP